MIQTLSTSTVSRIRALCVMEEAKKEEEKVAELSPKSPKKKGDKEGEKEKEKINNPPPPLSSVSIFAGLANKNIQVWIEVVWMMIIIASMSLYIYNRTPNNIWMDGWIDG